MRRVAAGVTSVVAFFAAYIQMIPVTQDMVLLGGSSLEENTLYAQAAQHEITEGGGPRFHWALRDIPLL